MSKNIFEEFIQVDLIDKGWSGDKKYCVIKKDRKKYLLRVCHIDKYESMSFLFKALDPIVKMGLPICDPVEISKYESNVYTLYEWVDGEDARECLSSFNEEDQYSFGFKSGEILKQIHSIPVQIEVQDWESRFNNKVDRKIKMYQECGIKIDGDHNFIRYIDQNRHLLSGRPQCFQHGDYHVGNFMIEDKNLVVIDFDRHDHGDPWEEFNRIVFSADTSPHFAKGQVNGYFNNDPPEEFFKLMAFYMASNTFASIPWCISANDMESLKYMTHLAERTLFWFNDMNSYIPNWYKT